MPALRRHWPEYLIEAGCLATFMLSAVVFATLLQHPLSPVSRAIASEPGRRAAMGLAMGATAVLLIYSRAGRRSGAHMNPAVTLTFYRLGKVAGPDAAWYVAAQFVGGTAGLVAGTALLGGLPSDPAVNYVATLPGHAGAPAAFAGEVLISFVMMAGILLSSNTARLAPFTGLVAGLLVALYILLEAPISGMSMNPARSFGSNVLAHAASTLWIYFLAPTAGMLLAAEFFVRRHGRAAVRCAKLHHTGDARCIFRCGYMPAPQEVSR